MNPNHFALIMAGGQGTRFWPWSIPAKPKQFLAVIGDQPLLTQTYQRLQRFIPRSNIFVIADRCYLPAVRECLNGFAEENFIAEPAPRNTAPALILANIVLSRRNPDASLLVAPSDHFISKEEVFAAQLGAALEYASSGRLVTAGIMPDSPHTGYGYIHFSARNADALGGTRFYPVLAFKEKPDRATARRYLKQKTYCWNSGMFVYTLRRFRELLSAYNPYYAEQYEALERCRNDTARFSETFCAIKPDSIDYALLEKAKEVSMFKAAFAWNDVGSWSSVYDMSVKDTAGNVAKGEPILIDAKDSLVVDAGDRPLALIGLRDIAVISTANGVLVAGREHLQRVKEALEKLKQKPARK